MMILDCEDIVGGWLGISVPLKNLLLLKICTFTNLCLKFNIKFRAYLWPYNILTYVEESALNSTSAPLGPDNLPNYALDYHYNTRRRRLFITRPRTHVYSDDHDPISELPTRSPHHPNRCGGHDEINPECHQNNIYWVRY